MKKITILGIIALVLIIAILESGCGTKKSSYVGKLLGSEDERETQEASEYRSLIEKYVSKAGEPYTAHDYMIKEKMTAKHSAEEWLDADGKLKLPFDPDDIKGRDTDVYDGVTYDLVFLIDGTENYYIPDEVAAKASTEELADVFLSYSHNGGWMPMVFGRYNLDSTYEHNFALLLSNSNALEESLKREDFAKVYFEIYMIESENIPKHYEGENNLLYIELLNKTNTLDLIEVLLAQPEAYEQLAKEQREMLIRRVLEREKQGEEGKLFSDDSEYWTQFFACIAGEMYLPADMAAIPDTTGGLAGITGAIQKENNPWLDTINEMDLTEKEQNILDKYFGGDEQS